VKPPRALALLAVLFAASFIALALIASSQYLFPFDYTIHAWVQGGRHPALGGVVYLLWTSPIPRAWRWVGTALSALAVLVAVGRRPPPRST
jgi:hypothetical protein